MLSNTFIWLIYQKKIFRRPGKKKSLQIQKLIRHDCLRFVLFYTKKTNNSENEKKKEKCKPKYYTNDATKVKRGLITRTFKLIVRDD